MGTVVELTRFLLDLMPDNARAPEVTPTWVGGVMATRELGGLYVEIETAPNQPARSNYVDERDGRGFGEEGDVVGNKHNPSRRLDIIADAMSELNP